MANLRVRHNAGGRVAALNLGKTQEKLAKSLEKLSSGYAINRSADNAAGLAISEKLRALITGLEQAERNSYDGTQLIQTGEGALSEIHAMLNRAIELATTSANGTYRDEIDRKALQQELDNLCDEIGDITKKTQFNTIKLFQDKGFAYESSTETSHQMSTALSSPNALTLDDLLSGPKGNGINIVYTERTDFFTTTQTAGGSNTLGSDIQIGNQNLSDILKTEIIPNTVKNILSAYPAFSYLDGSSIGIGLEYFSQGSAGGSTTLAYVKAGVSSSGVTNGSTLVSREDFITYTLGVNTSVLSNVKDRAGLEALEATIAHEMVHAFMDEATTSGMFGKIAVDNSSFTANVDTFPDWFIEGMAQTASGPGNWLKNMGISDSSTSDNILTAIQNNKLGSGTSASQYGTGYLACMYLGSVISGGGAPSSVVDAASVSSGLTRLFNEVVGGKSLNGAISSLTNGKFGGYADFASKFNAGSAEIGSFVNNLLTATGSGRGGIISGDLKAKDLTPNNDLGDSVKLFQLNPNNSEVKNVYPKDYNVYSGGAANVDGTKPTGFNPVQAFKEYGDLAVSGPAGYESYIKYDSSTGKLTVKTGGDIRISMKAAGSSSSTNKIVLQGTGKATLNGVNLSSTDALMFEGSGEVTYEGENILGGVSLGDNVQATFHGIGQLRTDKFQSKNTSQVRFDGGAVIVGPQGGGPIDGKVIIDHASVAADISNAENSSSNPLVSIDLPLTMLPDLKDIASVAFDGGTPSRMLLSRGQVSKLWLDPSNLPPDNIAKITFTDSSGTSCTRSVKYDPKAKKFEPLKDIEPFNVIGGTIGTDWDYDVYGQTLIIKSDKPLTISGGSGYDKLGNSIFGRIKLEDSPAGASPKNFDLTLDNVNSQVTSGSAFDLGKGNNVILNLKENADQKVINSFKSGDGYAGIAIGDGTSLTINGNGKLEAYGGEGSAGIGSSSHAAPGSSTSSITINSGTITAEGGHGGAGIGSGTNSGFGNITIKGGTINSTGGTGGAGIGASTRSKVGDITIEGGTINATSLAHGAGIGGGWEKTSVNGDITINGGNITATGIEHGTGIGAGCQGTSGKITIKGGDIKAVGGNDGAGIGASWIGQCNGIEITGGDITARGGNNGAGIGAGSQNSGVTGDILIGTTGFIVATGGINGVGIGSGYGNSSCGDIKIIQGTIRAIGSTDSTGIGSGRNSTSGDITIGNKDDSTKRVIVDAIGGMKYNGGNIISYKDGNHTQSGTLSIVGENTSVRPGKAGEGLYSTSSTLDKDGKTPLYAYPVYLFETNPPLDSGENLKGILPLPDPDKINKNTIKISATADDGTKKEWTQGLLHPPENNTFIWMSGQGQNLTIDYELNDGTKKTVNLNLEFHSDAGVFRIPVKQPDPPAAQKPEYFAPAPGDTPPPADPPEDNRTGGIILHIGAGRSETLEVPRYYLSLDSLKMGNLDITTQKNALKTIPIVKDAIDRVSSVRASYGALANRLEHNQQYLSQTHENATATESRIRDVDMAKEYSGYVALMIRSQSSQAMLAQSNQGASQVLQLLR